MNDSIAGGYLKGWFQKAAVAAGMACIVVVSFVCCRIYADSAPQAVAPKFVKKISGDPVMSDWIMSFHASDGLLFACSHRDGGPNIFSYDANGDLKFLKFLDLAADLGHDKRHLDCFMAFTDQKILYLSGAWTHAKGDKDSLGLSWYKINPQDGSYTKGGKIDCPAGELNFSPDKKHLYLSAYFSGAVIEIKIAADGAPSLGSKASGKGLGERFAITADGKSIYSLTDDALGWVNVKPDGSVVYGGNVSLSDLGPGDKINRRGIAVSPDGKHVYASLGKFGKNTVVSMFNADPTTGALTFARKLDVDPNMKETTHITFLSDGKSGYYHGVTVGSFTRDPQTGEIKFGGKADGKGGYYFLYVPSTGAIYVSGNELTKGFSMLSATRAGG